MHARVADDDNLTRTVLKRTLERWGLEVSVAMDGGDAWRILQETPAIKLAIFDWMMPEIDGPELCRRVRQDPLRAHLYILLLTGRRSSADMVAGLDAGADDYMSKPFDPEELRARVHVGMRVVSLQDRGVGCEIVGSRRSSVGSLSRQSQSAVPVGNRAWRTRQACQR